MSLAPRWRIHHEVASQHVVVFFCSEDFLLRFEAEVIKEDLDGSTSFVVTRRPVRRSVHGELPTREGCEHQVSFRGGALTATVFDVVCCFNFIWFPPMSSITNQIGDKEWLGLQWGDVKPRLAVHTRSDTWAHSRDCSMCK